MKNTVDYSQKISFILTLGLWIFFFIFSLCFSVPKEKKSEFKTISLKLSQNVSSEKLAPVKAPIEKPLLEESKKAAVVEQSEKKLSPKPSTKPVEKAIQKSTEKKTETVKKTTQTKSVAKPQNVVREEKLVQSIEDAMKAQQKIQKKEVVWDESLFADSEEVQSSNDSSVVQVTTTTQELQGSVAALSTEYASEVSVSGTANKIVTREQRISEEKLFSSLQGAISQGGTVVSESMQQVTRNAGTSIAMSDGSVRQLIHPKNIEIQLSVQAQKLIDSSKEVSILFSVLDEGTIPLAEITISPRGALPLLVESEIKAQIAKWRFESGKGNGQARFTYSITKE